MQPDAPAPNYLWNVLKSSQSYRNIAYLLITFPLGLMYFLFLVVAGSIGASLAIVGIGLFILLGAFGFSGVLANFERWVSNQLLGTDLQSEKGTLFQLRNKNNWRALGYIALKFPLGLLTFVFTLGVVSAVMGLITMPIGYTSESPIIIAREIDTLWEAIVSSFIGLAIAPFALILLGKVTLLWRNLSLRLLRTDRTQSSEKQKHISREEIEQDVINRLIDEGLVNEELLSGQKQKYLSYKK